MASSYALPFSNSGNHHGHSHSAVHLSPSTANSNGFANGSAGSHRKAASMSNGSLYTHREASRETSPSPSPVHEEDQPYAFQTNMDAVHANGQMNGHGHLHGNVHSHDREHLHDHACELAHDHSHSHAHAHNDSHSHAPSHSHGHTHSHSHAPMKSRTRGESDLGRPADSSSTTYQSTLGSIPAAPASWFSLPEALTALLIPLPYMLASAAYSSVGHAVVEHEFPPLSAYTKLKQSVLTATSDLPQHVAKRPSGILEACTLASGTLLLVGILAKIRASERVLDRRKEAAAARQTPMAIDGSAARSVLVRSLSVGLPFYAAMKIGGMRTGLVLLAAVAANLTCLDTTLRTSLHDWKHIASNKKVTLAAILLSAFADFAGLTIHASANDLSLGYLALAISIFVLPTPLPTRATPAASRPSSKAGSPKATSFPGRLNFSASSPLTSSAGDVNMTIMAGAFLSLITVGVSIYLARSPSISTPAIILSTLSIATSAAAVLFSQPSSLRSQTKAGLGLGCMLTASCAFLFSPELWPGTVCNGGLSALAFAGVLFDTASSHSHDHHSHSHAHAHDHDHVHTGHSHAHHTVEAKHSAFTSLVLGLCKPGSLLHSILLEKDSRRIAYFTCLNFGFMLVQGLYGYLSGSLGLLSDTVHMFFDCLGLVVGLAAAVASKWPTSPEMPYGWGKLNTLAGFGNGVFLMLVSVEFVWEAMEGILEGRELRHVTELLVVSTLGFLVNMVGLVAFGHAHAGHDHGGHDHGHGHDHDGHSHDHNENMHGIFLHVAADAGGSLAVILSTALTLYKPWYLWDPLATILIAVLIFAAAVPLVTASGRKLLLVVPGEAEYVIKNTLQEVGEMRGVVGVTVPRFWVDDRGEVAHDHHGHDHSHDHSHSHSHAGQDHIRDHGHDHSHDHHSHDHHAHDHLHEHHAHDHGSPAKSKVCGVMHVIAAPYTDLEDVRQRVDDLCRERSMDVVVHVEREGDGSCWCGGGR